MLASVIVFIGLSLIFNSLAGWLYGYSVTSFDSPFTGRPWFGAGYMSAHEAGSIVVTLCVLALVYAFFRFTPLGLAMRAAAQNPVSSRLVGIRVGWMLAIGWGLAAAIGVGRRHDGGADRLSRSQHDGRRPALRLRRRGAGRHRQSVRRGLRRLRRSACSATSSAPMWSATRSSFRLRSRSSSPSWCGGRPACSGASSWRGCDDGRAGGALGGLVVVAVAALALAFPFVASGYHLYQGAQVLILAIALIGLNLLTGFNGQISLGHGAFFAIGGYGAAILMAKSGLPYWAAIPLASVVCFVAGFLFGFPALRFGGLYLALATFALAVATPQILDYKGFDASPAARRASRFPSRPRRSGSRSTPTSGSISSASPPPPRSTGRRATSCAGGSGAR